MPAHKHLSPFPDHAKTQRQGTQHRGSLAWLVGCSLGFGFSASAAHSIGYSTTQFADSFLFDPSAGRPMDIPPTATHTSPTAGERAGSVLAGSPSFDAAPDIYYPGTASATGEFEARYKELRVRSTATADTGWRAYSDVSTSWTETLTVSHPDYDGDRGLWGTDEVIRFEGTGRAGEPTFWGDLGEAKVKFTVSMKLTQEGFPDQERSVTGGWLSVPGLSTGIPYGWAFEPGDALFPGNFEITYGDPFTFEVSLQVVSQVGTFLNPGGPIPPDGTPSRGEANGDFSHTLAWQGMGVLKDSEGNPIEGFTVESESGTDWLTAVPEPGTYALLTGLACIGGAARRRLRPS